MDDLIGPAVPGTKTDTTTAEVPLSHPRLEMNEDDLWDFLRTEFPQAVAFGFAIDHLDPTRIRLSLPCGENSLRPGNTVSGPTLMTLADTATYLLLLARIGRVALAVTTNLNIHFLRKPGPGVLNAEATLLKLGKRLAIAEVELRSEGADDIVAHATVTYSIPPR